MKKNRLLSALFLLLLAGPSFSYPAGQTRRSYTVPGIGAFSLEVPVSWMEEVRQPDPRLPPTIILRDKKDGDFELLVTPIPPGQPGTGMTLEKLEATVLEVGRRALPRAREESVKLEKIDGEGVVGRYFLLTEKVTPPGEYPSFLGGCLLIDPVVASFTMLLRDPQAQYVKLALSALGSARLRKGHGGRYRGTLDHVRIGVLAARAHGLEVKVEVDRKTSYRANLASFLVEAEAIPGGISLWIDGSDFEAAGALLTALTNGLEEIR